MDAAIIIADCFFTAIFSFLSDNISLTVSFLGSIIVALIAFWTGLKVQHNNYRDEYYKTVIRKRLEAYQFIESLLGVMRMTIYDDYDHRQYHAIFEYSEDDFFKSRHDLYKAIARCTWLSHEMLEALSTLDEIFYEIDNKIVKDREANVEIGKQYFEKLIGAQSRIGGILIKDTACLHEVKSFLKSKRESYQCQQTRRMSKNG